jgi:hypothetical protein
VNLINDRIFGKMLLYVSYPVYVTKNSGLLIPIPVAERSLGMRIRIPSGAWIFVLCVVSKRQKEETRTMREASSKESKESKGEGQ